MSGAPNASWRGLWHAGLGPALYSAGISAALLQLSARWTGVPTEQVALVLAATAVSAFGMMLLDRVKWRDALLDPADESTNPASAALVRARPGVWRTVVVLCGLVGAGLAWITGGLVASAGVMLGYAAIGLYAGRPGAGRPSALRLKDIPVVKNIFVAFGIVGLSVTIALGRDLGTVRTNAVVVTAAFLLCLVASDALLCDLPDEEADRAFGVRTLPVLIGPGLASGLAIGLMALAGGALLLTHPAESPWITALWAVAPPVSAALVILARPGAIKTLVDLRPACIAFVGALILLA